MNINGIFHLFQQVDLKFRLEKEKHRCRVEHSRETTYQWLDI